ncbi:MAG: histone deacetylase [Acidobacteriota bacterium]
MILFSSPRFGEHTTPPGHPERPERALLFDALAAEYRRSGGAVCEPRAATRHELARVHSAAHLDQMAAADGQAVMFDPDTYTSPESIAIAHLAAGAAIDAARHAATHAEPTLALVRPPGHHAEPNCAMGFCLYNNIAVAAAALRAEGLARVAIVDIDVHHGNGTQVAFYDDPTVLYVSTHQHPYFPGTGADTETGAGPGRGFTVNLPLAAGATDAEYARVYESAVVPALERFQPGVILVSAGFDAHALDPLGGMRVSTEGYAHVVALIDDAARRLCDRRLMLVTEGGYHLGALRECLENTINTLR